MLLDLRFQAWRRVALLCLTLLLPALAGAPLGAQEATAPAAAAPAEPGSELTVYLLTMGPGDLVYERFGHNALWIRDEARGTDLAYNYGLFDFQQENFILRFIQGRMLYWMDGYDAERTIAPYTWADRAVWAQELNLSPRQRAELRDFLEWNAREENRFYRYDYYRDNCSTRVRDALDRVLGGQLRAQTENTPSRTTYRSHTRRLTTNDVPIYTALNIALGRPTDREISAWEEMFIPMKLQEHARTLTIRDASGREVPLVRAEQTLYQSSRGPIREAPPSWLGGYLLVGVSFGGLLALLAYGAPRSRAARLAFSATAALWALLAGTAGVVMAGLWLLTDHTAAYANENLLQMSPLALPLVLLVPALAYGARWAARAALWLAVAGAALTALGLLLQLVPGFGQVNGEVIALALPVQLGLAWAVYHLSRVVRQRAVPESPAARKPARRRGAPAR